MRRIVGAETVDILLSQSHLSSKMQTKAARCFADIRYHVHSEGKERVEPRSSSVSLINETNPQHLTHITLTKSDVRLS